MSARVVVLVALCALSCQRRFPDDGLVLGGVRVPYATLRDGWSAYGAYCSGCHGEHGDGRGLSGVGLRPPPRDFRLGTIKFASVPSGQLPTDADLVRAVRHGLHGTAMLAFELPDEELLPIVQYVKTFSPRWRHEHAGVAITPTRDPWRTHPSDGVARGDLLYHGLVQCFTCHPAYRDRDGIADATRTLQGVAAAEVRGDLAHAVMQIGDDGLHQMPPDFARQPLKAGDTVEAIYVTVSAGVGGTAMPTFHDALPEEDLWALAHYVRDRVERAQRTSGIVAIVRRAALL